MLARPPIRADRRTLASATSRTPLLAPRLEVAQNLFLRDSASLELSLDVGAERGVELPLQLQGKGDLGAREEDAGETSPARHQDGRLRSEKAGCLVAKLAHSAQTHVVTLVTIITSSSCTCCAWSQSRRLEPMARLSSASRFGPPRAAA